MSSWSNVASNPIFSVASVIPVIPVIPPSKSVLKRKPVEEVPEVRRSARTKKNKSGFICFIILSDRYIFYFIIFYFTRFFVIVSINLSPQTSKLSIRISKYIYPLE